MNPITQYQMLFNLVSTIKTLANIGGLAPKEKELVENLKVTVEQYEFKNVAEKRV